VSLAVIVLVCQVYAVTTENFVLVTVGAVIVAFATPVLIVAGGSVLYSVSKMGFCVEGGGGGGGNSYVVIIEVLMTMFVTVVGAAVKVIYECCD
jgi:hypothetical protein